MDTTLDIQQSAKDKLDQLHTLASELLLLKQADDSIDIGNVHHPISSSYSSQGTQTNIITNEDGTATDESTGTTLNRIIDGTHFPFLDLPVELQLHILRYLIGPFDIRHYNSIFHGRGFKRTRPIPSHVGSTFDALSNTILFAENAWTIDLCNFQKEWIYGKEKLDRFMNSPIAPLVRHVRFELSQHGKPKGDRRPLLPCEPLPALCKAITSLPSLRRLEFSISFFWNRVRSLNRTKQAFECLRELPRKCVLEIKHRRIGRLPCDFQSEEQLKTDLEELLGRKVILDGEHIKEFTKDMLRFGETW